MAKYIENKKVNMIKSNKVNNLQGISKATWKFVSVFYNAEWDSLVTDIHNNILRQKILLYYTPKTNLVKNGKPKGKDTDKLTNIERLLPPILTKTPKEINKISKFFKTKMSTYANISQDKSYA